MNEIIFLKSSRVVLRPVLKEDIPEYIIRWINDPEVTQYLKVHFPMMHTDENEWFDNLHKRKPHDVVLTIVVDEKPIGVIGLHKINFKDRIATTGTLIGEKDYWGKGYGTEAKMLLLGYAFNTLNLRKICSHVIAFNERSRRYSLSCGYEEEGRLTKHLFRKGKYWDMILLAVFKNKFLPLWKKFAKKHAITTI